MQDLEDPLKISIDEGLRPFKIWTWNEMKDESFLQFTNSSLDNNILQSFCSAFDIVRTDPIKLNVRLRDSRDFKNIKYCFPLLINSIKRTRVINMESPEGFPLAVDIEILA